MPAERRTLRRACAALLALAIAGVLPAGARAEGGVGFRVDGAPGSSLENGFITLRAAPGAAASGYFFATNGGGSAAQVRVYAADGVTGETTGIVYTAAGEALSDAGGWLGPSTAGLLLPADGSRRIDFSVRVPGGSEPGDHVGGIVLEQRRASGGISQIVRNVVPVLIDVSGPANSSMALRSADVSDLPGTSLPAVTVRMANTGGRICRPRLTVALRGPSEDGAPVSRTLDAVLPGDSVPYPLPWPRKLERGSYDAAVSLEGCGAAVSLRTDVQASPGPTVAPTSPVKSPAVVPVTKVPPTKPTFTPPGGKSPAAPVVKGPGAIGPSSPGASGKPPKGATGSSDRPIKADDADVASKIKEFGQSAINALPSVLERAVAPLSLLALMLLFLFAQEAFTRKDPKLAMAPIQRDPDLDFEPLDASDFASGATGGSDLEIVRSGHVARLAS